MRLRWSRPPPTPGGNPEGLILDLIPIFHTVVMGKVITAAVGIDHATAFLATLDVRHYANLKHSGRSTLTVQSVTLAKFG